MSVRWKNLRSNHVQPPSGINRLSGSGRLFPFRSDRLRARTFGAMTALVAHQPPRDSLLHEGS